MTSENESARCGRCLGNQIVRVGERDSCSTVTHSIGVKALPCAVPAEDASADARSVQETREMAHGRADVWATR